MYIVCNLIHLDDTVFVHCPYTSLIVDTEDDRSFHQLLLNLSLIFLLFYENIVYI